MVVIDYIFCWLDLLSYYMLDNSFVRSPSRIGVEQPNQSQQILVADPHVILYDIWLIFPFLSRLRPQPGLPVQRPVPGLRQLLRWLPTSLRQRKCRGRVVDPIPSGWRMHCSAGSGKLVAFVAANNRRQPGKKRMALKIRGLHAIWFMRDITYKCTF